MKTSLKLAHVHQETLEAHLLEEHLLEVGSLASRFAESFGNAARTRTETGNKQSL